MKVMPTLYGITVISGTGSLKAGAAMPGGARGPAGDSIGFRIPIDRHPIDRRALGQAASR